MKKYSIIAILLVVMMLLSSCIGNAPVTSGNTLPSTAETKGTETTPPTAPETTPPTAPATTPATTPTTAVIYDDGLQFISPQGAGTGDARYIIRALTTKGSVNAETKLPTSMPVYKNVYYNGWGVYYELTDEIIETNRANIKEFISLAFGDDVAENTDFSMETHQLGEFKIDTEFTNHLAVTMNRIRCSLNDPIPENLTDEEFLNHPIIKAALEYAGIKNPELTRAADKHSGEKDGYFTIVEKCDDPIQAAFNEIEWSIQGGLDAFHIRGRNGECAGLEEYGDYEVIPYEEVFEKLSVRFPEMKTGKVMADIRYYEGFIFEEKVGVYIPFYRFYIESGDKASDGTELWKVVDVVMIKATMDELKAK